MGARAGLEAAELGFKPTGPTFIRAQGQLLDSQHLPCRGTTSQRSSLPQSVPPPLEGLSPSGYAWKTRPKRSSPPCHFPRDSTVSLPRFVPTSRLQLRPRWQREVGTTADKQLHGARSCPGKARNDSHTGEAQVSSSFCSAQEACPDTWDPDLSQKPSRAPQEERAGGRRQRREGRLPTNTVRAGHGREEPRGEEPVLRAPFCQGKACFDPVAIWQRGFGGPLEPHQCSWDRHKQHPKEL